jgi:hypothetical protein
MGDAGRAERGGNQPYGEPYRMSNAGSTRATYARATGLRRIGTVTVALAVGGVAGVAGVARTASQQVIAHKSTTSTSVGTSSGTSSGSSGSLGSSSDGSTSDGSSSDGTSSGSQSSSSGSTSVQAPSTGSLPSTTSGGS